jgi:hypothetical protein
MLFEDYAVGLDGISEPHLAAVLQEYLLKKNWFPKLAELMGLWEGERCRDREHLRRTRILLGKEEPKAWERASLSEPAKEAA